MKTVPSSKKPSSSSRPEECNRPSAAEFVDRALRVGINCYSGIARTPGVGLSTHGLLGEVQISEDQAMRYLCATLMSHERGLMKMSFGAFAESRRQIAHVLLLAESLCIKAGEGFVVQNADDFHDSLTDAQLFGLLCESVESWAEFEACLKERDKQAKAFSHAGKVHAAQNRLDEAQRSLQSLRESSPQVAA